IFAVGTTAVTFTATDTNGNTTTSTFDITVTDTEDPTFSGMPANITQTADAGNCSAEVDWTAPTANDNCAVQSLTSDHDPMDDFPVGTTTVTYTATDIHGNSATSSFTITVTDDEAPTISDTPSNITVSNDAGLCSADVTWTAPTADDNCPGTSLTSTHDSGDTFAVGTTTVTYTAEDAAGNQTTSSFTVTVTDDEAPMIGSLYSEDFENETPVDPNDLCVAGGEYTPDDGNWSLGPACSVSTNGIPKLVDVAGDIYLEYNQKYPVNSEVWNSADMDVTAFDEVEVSLDIRSFGGLEISGNVKDEFDLYAVLDGVESSIVSFDGHVDGTGSANGVTKEASFSESVDVSGASNLSLRIRIKISGGDGSESYMVDDISVDAPLSDLALSNDAGVCSAGASWLVPSATDNCSVTLTSTHNPGDSFAVGTTTVTYTATDPASNTATLSFDVVVSDDEAPAIPQMDDITVSTDDGLCTADVTWSDPAATDNCGVTSLVASPASGSTFALGTNAVTYTAMDEAGNTTTMTFNVIVEDNENPEILDSEGATFVTTDLTQDTDAGLCTAVVTWTAPVGADNCTLASLTSTHNPGDTFDKGTTTVTYTAEDNAGNTTTVSFDVIVSDNEAPTITDVPSNQSVSTDAGECSAEVTWDAPTYGDNCGVATSGGNYSSGESFGPGTTTVTFTATDDAGNETTASFTVTVTDNEAPTIADMPADTTLSNDPGVCGASVLWDEPTPDDNCGIQTFTSSHDNGSIYPVGSTVVTYTAMDSEGNTTTASFTITVTDDEAPAIPQMDDITVSTEAGICTADVTWSDPAATDNCTVTSLSSDIASGTTFSLGTTAVTYTASDAAGNTTTMTFDVIVEDNEAPTITEAACNMQVECDGAGNTAALTAWLTDNAGATATDNCSAVTWSNDFTTMANTCGGAGAVQVVFTATDEAGNTSTSTATFTIVDTTAPTITAGATDSTVECDGSGNTTQFNAWLNDQGGATASESCSSVTWSNNYLSTTNEGETIDFSDGCGATGSVTITFTATDVCGNASTTNATFTIEDTTNPTAVAQNHTVTLDASGNGTMVAGDIDNGSSDGCSSVTLSASQTSFTCSDLGANTITLTVTDACSNASTATATVTVKDEVAPNITVAAADTTFECNGTDYSAQFAAWLADNGGADATDACGPLTWTNNSTGLVPGCGDSESEEVTFTVTDGSGNSSTTTATFSVTDTAPPTIASEAIDITLECNGTGNTVELNAWLLANGGAGAATDLCGDVTWSHNFDDYALTCAGTGAVEVIFSATDDCGNAATTTAMFEIVDTTAPTLTLAASDRTVECGSSNASDLSGWLASNGGATADELCGTVTWTNDFTALSDDCGNTGSALVTFTASDDCGNTTTTSATFTIEDTTSPIALGADLTVILDGNGQATITPEDIDNGSNDACGDVTLSLDITSFDCDDVGPNDVVLTVTDDCANSASATVTVIVTAVDNTAPTISNLPADITQNNDAGNCSAVVTYTMPSFQDNCAGGSIVSDYPSGTAFPVGETTVTFTATDPSGNDTTATFTVTVLDAEAPTFGGSAPDPSDENYALGPISNSGASTIQNGWTGGAQAYFQNDATDDETVTDAEANSGSNSWFFTDAYNNPGQGSPHAPSLGLPSGTGPGTTFTLEFYFKAEATADGDGSVHKIYQGTYAGDDRTGFNINIQNSTDASGEGGLHIFTYSYDAGSFPITTIASNLDRNVWHKVNVTYTIDASGDPNLDTAEYSVDDAASVSANTWVNVWRVANGFTQAYGDNIAWAGSGNSSGFYYDDITYSSDFDGSSQTIGFETAQAGSAFADITLSNDAGNCSAIATWSEPTTADNCAVASVTSTHDSGDAFAVGTTTVTYTVVDSAGNTTTGSFDVTVTDDENPVIAGTPANITQTADAGLCSAVVNWTAATASDNCAIATFSSDHSSGDAFPVGTTTVTYTATDIHGNTTTSTFDITVTDDENPTLANVPSDITQTADAGQCGAVVDWEFDIVTDSTNPVTASDNCAVATLTSTHDSGDTFPVGTTTVTFTATDIHGNVTTASFDVTITDDEAPAIAGTPADITQTNDAGNCSAAVTWTEPTASDNCGVTSFTSTHSPGATFAVGTTTVTYTAQDAAGNTTTSSFTVIVTDDENPVISGTPTDITQDNDLGNCSAVVTWTEPTAADNCAIATFTSTHNPGDTFAVGTTTVTYTATDIHSNVSTSSFDITVEDAENPVITTEASDLTVECDGSGNLTELNTWLNNHGGSEASDNCAVTSITNDYDVANMSDDCGLTGSILVTFTHTDAAGNSATSSATFTIEDTTAPTFQPNTGSVTVECDGTGNVDEIDAWLNLVNSSTASDACGGVTLEKTTTLLTDECAATGTASVSFLITDDCGNQVDTTLTFTIEDTTGPEFLTTADDLTVECDGAGNTAALQAWLDNHAGATATDVCGDFTWSNDFDALSDDCGATGSRTVTFTATDECGNESYTSATFTIEDTTAPTIASEAMDMTVECDGLGNTAALNSWLAANGNAGAASDICGGVTWSNDFTAL
ncbi:MAG: HYR domain-containing protein, partial [Flavobacteriales bacterium]